MLRSELIIVENSHHLNPALPLLPHVVEIAGCTTLPARQLPGKLEKIFLQAGSEGIILASFGSLVLRMPGSLTSKFLAAFGRLNETVVTRMAVPPDVHVSNTDVTCHTLEIISLIVISVMIETASSQLTKSYASNFAAFFSMKH
jgi:hypothetical protein